MLFYTVISDQSKTYPLRVPKDWGMFTDQGNRSLQLKAEALVKNVEGVTDLTKQIKAFEKFFKSYHRMSKVKTLSEASDTEVRNTVLSFAERVGQCLNLDESIIDKIWDRSR